MDTKRRDALLPFFTTECAVVVHSRPTLSVRFNLPPQAAPGRILPHGEGRERAQRRQYTSLSKSDGDARAARQLPVSKYPSPLQTPAGSQAIVSRVQGCRVSRNSIFWRLHARRSQPDCKPLPGEVSVQIVPHSPRCNAVPAGYRSLHDRGSHHLRLGMHLVRSYSVLHAAQHRKIRLRIRRW